MHLSVKQAVALEAPIVAVAPEQSPADIVCLSFSDSDLACFSAAYELLREHERPSLRLANLSSLLHPMSVDLYMEEVLRHARVVVMRILGGLDRLRYGAEEAARVARAHGIQLLILPGCDPDPRLAALSTVSAEQLTAVDACLSQGGVENARRVLEAASDWISGAGGNCLPEALPMPVAGCYREVMAVQEQGRAVLVLYRAYMLAADTAPVDAMLDALAAKGLSTRAYMVTSLKDPLAVELLHAEIAHYLPDIVLDATAFAAGEGMHPLSEFGVPILQIALANASQEAWEQSPRGLGATDLAMHVVLPETDGRIFTRAISFKTSQVRAEHTQYAPVLHQPEKSRVAYVASLARAWVRLAKTPISERKVALLLSDYQGRAGRCAYAVGLDAPASALHILSLLHAEGYGVECAPWDVADLMQELQGHRTVAYPLASYWRRLECLPEAARAQIMACWGAPESDAACDGNAFVLNIAQYGHVFCALQPDRGAQDGDRKAGYHDPVTPPRHGYLAFYWWLQECPGVDAMIHLGTHGNLEWLPGKSVALSQCCWPEIAWGPLPVLYPYIVSDPGEAAQAKRRLSAVTISHLTPPLMKVDLSESLLHLESLVEEYSAADGLDARRMELLRAEILHQARQSGLPGQDDPSLLNALEAHLCDIKEQRVGSGLHVFGVAPAAQAEGEGVVPMHVLEASAKMEARSLLAGLAGRFIPPGPGGSPARGRRDVLPTGRNIITMDPRLIPTPTAWSIGKRAAEEWIRRYVQDHGDWPRQVVLDVWGSASLRNGGDEIAQALVLMGAVPLRDPASGRVIAFRMDQEDPPAWPRVDVTLRVSGLFRDMFGELLMMFDDVARVIAQAEGWQEGWRVFSNAPGAYGAAVSRVLDHGAWRERSELAEAYLAASHFAYGRHAQGTPDREALCARIQQANAFLHVQDQREMDVLSGADFVDHEGGFRAAARVLGSDPALYHLDTSQPERIKVRTLEEEISLTLHSRALSASWIARQMAHGYAGAAALADVVDQLFAFAATADAVPSAQFDAVFDAYLHNERVRQFIQDHNPAALAAMRARFEEAMRRGFWLPRRNSVGYMLGQTEAAA